MGMEVLDNLPHDKIRGKRRHKMEQVEIVFKQNNEQQHEENFVPLSDPLLKMMLRTVPNYSMPTSNDTDACWIPSIACGVLHHAINQRPNLGLIMADFDWLPAPDLDLDINLDFDSSKTVLTKISRAEVPAEGSPIVTDMEGKDHESYLTAPPHCDILFPTDFEKLASFVKRCLSSTTATPTSTTNSPSHHRRRRCRENSQSSSASTSTSTLSSSLSSSNSIQVTTTTTTTTPIVRVEKQSQFLKRWGPEHVSKTKSWLTGHTPLLHDFVNCSVLTISPEEST